MSIHVDPIRAAAGSSRLERKDASGGAGDITNVIENINRSFEELKQKNDAALAETKRGFDDVVRKDEVKRISDAIGEMDVKRKELENEIVALKRTNHAAAGEQKSAERLDYEKRFNEWFRKGESRDFTERDLRDLERKALSVGSEPDGGFTVLPEIDQAIDATIKLVSPMRQIATVRQTSNASYRRFVNIHGTTSGWVGESESRTSTTTPALKEVEIPVMEIYASPTATQSLLDDSFVNIEQWLADEVQLEFAYQEGAAFISGTGNKKPQGILSQTIAADEANLAFGSVGYYAAGASGAFDTTATLNPIYKMIYGLKAPYRAGASWIANRRTLSAARILKDSYGRYLWEPSVQAGAPSMLAGYPVYEMEDMPDIAANSYSMAFGDFRRAYTIVDRIGTRVLRDPYTSKPNVIFYTTKRVGGAVTMHEAYKLLKFSAS
jgi:HK97 family phage major capsid protein